MTENQNEAMKGNTAKAHDDLLRVIEFIQSFGSTDELESAFSAYKANGDWEIPKVREAIIQTLHELFLKQLLSGARTAYESLRESVDKLGDQARQVFAAISDDNLAGFLVKGTLNSRFEKDHPEPKKRVAAYVADTFFPDEKITCFIQASITAIHLAHELTKRPLRPGSLFHTNSVVLPLMLLQKHSHNISVYPYCGSAYDNLCGGWLPHNEDTKAHEYLDYILTNQPTPVRSFITPMAVTTDTSALLFTRTELIHIVQRLVQNTAIPVIMTFSSRIFENEDSANDGIRNSSLHPIPNSNWQERHYRAQLVIAWDDASTPYDDIPGKVDLLAKSGLDVHWQDQNLTWHLHTA